MSQEEEKFLKVQAEAKKLKSMYSEKTSSFNALILGESGAGKTYLLRTARKPVHIDLFDPGGAKGLREWIQKGDIIVDDYSDEDPKSPTQFLRWKADFDRRLKEGYFNHFATYAIDSSTTWADAIMNQILKKAGIPGEAPRFTHDYVPQKIEIRNRLRLALSLPCDFILTGHLEANKDVDDSGKEVLKFRFLTTGKGVVTIPLLFDELYVLLTKDTSEGTKYQLLTKKTGPHVARTRIGRDKFDKLEVPDLKALLKKAGLPYEDKPKLF